MTGWRITRIAALGVGLIFMAVVFARLGPHTIAQQLAGVGVGALWLLVAYAAGTIIGAIPWHLVLPDAARPTLRAAIASRFAASGANTILPVLGFGGEPIRLLWLRPADHAAGVAAIVIDRLLYTVASAIFLLAGAVAALRLAALPRSYVVAAVATAFGLFVLGAVAIWLAARHRMADRIHRLIRRLRRQAAPSEGGFGASVDHLIGQIVARRGRLAVALLLHVIARVALGLEVYAGFHALGVALPVDTALAFAAVPVLLGFVGSVVPSQIGIQEGAQALIASALGIAPTTAVSVVLLQRVRQLVTAAFAWVLIVSTRKPKPASMIVPARPDPS